MDPLQGLIVYGPLGLWALAATMALVRKDSDNGKLRDTCAAEIAALNEAHAAKFAVIGKEHAAVVTAAAIGFAQSLREQGDRYDRQMAEVTQRSFKIVTDLSDKLSAFADSITRRR